MRIRRNADEGMRALERDARTGDRDAAFRLGLAMLRAGSLPHELGRLNEARAAAGLPQIPLSVGPNCLLTMLGDPPSALVRVTWDDLVVGLDLEDQLIYFDGREFHRPDWIIDQADEDAHQWIKERGLRLTDDQRQAVTDQFFYKVEEAWFPESRIDERSLENWVVRPINRHATAVMRNEEWDDRLATRILDFCGGEAIRIEKIDARKDVDADETGVTFRVFWPIWTAWFELGTDEAVWRDPEVLRLEDLSPDNIMSLARSARQSDGITGETVRISRPSWDYDTPDDDLLFAEIAKHAPKPKPRRRRRKNEGRSDLILTVAPDPDYPQFTSFVWSPVVHEPWQMFGYGAGGTPLGPLSLSAIRAKIERMVRVAEENGYSVLVDDKTNA